MFTVRWKRSARDQLANLWLHADSGLRQAITAATAEIEKGLRRNPERKGESREGEQRVWFVFPLCVYFEVDVQRNIARVLHVYSFRPKA